MIQNLKDKLLGFFDELSCRVSFLLSRKRRQSPVCAPRSEVIRGTAHNIILVTSPDPEIFREAMFILQDDYMRRPGIGKEELLRQARDTAENYVLRFVPPDKGRRRPELYLLPAFTAALGYLAAKWIV